VQKAFNRNNGTFLVQNVYSLVKPPRDGSAGRSKLRMLTTTSSSTDGSQRTKKFGSLDRRKQCSSPTGKTAQFPGATTTGVSIAYPTKTK
jgi:hypothetical protein